MLRKLQRVTKIIVILSAGLVQGQTSSTPAINQKSAASPCSNIVAKGNVNCSSAGLTHRTQAQELDRLRKKTNALANEIVTFDYEREGTINAWMQQAMAQSVLDAMSHNEKGSQEFAARKQFWDQETYVKFLELYWPRVTSLENELAEYGLDVSPIARAVALNGPLKAGLMLSVVASKIGVRPTLSRTVTPLEASVLARSSALPEVEISALLSDPNSSATAETLRKGFGQIYT